VLAQTGLAKAGRMVRAANASGEVWFVGPYVVRINTRTERGRLLHERDVLEALPRGLPVPTLVDYGASAIGEWLVVTRVPGEELSRHWPTMSERQRADAIMTLGTALREFHHVDAKAAGLDRAPFLEGDTLECPHQLPVSRLLDRLAQCARLPYVDAAMIADAVDLLMNTAEFLDDDATHLVHGDLHFENVLWDGATLTAIIDFEWTRPGPADLDLDVLLHSLADPAAHVGLDYIAPRRADFDNVATWLRAAYPKLFSHPHLAERLTAYRLAYDTRALLQQPPDRPVALLAPQHPYNRVQRLVEGRSDLGWVLAG
jgi:aminoglycoside phosphotransferase (APT) family kinase protein